MRFLESIIKGFMSIGTAFTKALSGKDSGELISTIIGGIKKFFSLILPLKIAVKSMKTEIRNASRKQKAAEKYSGMSPAEANKEKRNERNKNAETSVGRGGNVDLEDCVVRDVGTEDEFVMTRFESHCLDRLATTRNYFFKSLSAKEQLILLGNEGFDFKRYCYYEARNRREGVIGFFLRQPNPELMRHALYKFKEMQRDYIEENGVPDFGGFSFFINPFYKLYKWLKGEETQGIRDRLRLNKIDRQLNFFDLGIWRIDTWKDEAARDYAFFMSSDRCAAITRLDKMNFPKVRVFDPMRDASEELVVNKACEKGKNIKATRKEIKMEKKKIRLIDGASKDIVFGDDLYKKGKKKKSKGKDKDDEKGKKKKKDSKKGKKKKKGNMDEYDRLTEYGKKSSKKLWSAVSSGIAAGNIRDAADIDTYVYTMDKFK